ncbi:hypothetical protein V3C99_009226 [Haemonchus contortus]|uniref:non-specific protein-tyrosine kinase n=1 Tax=Haemonchus contortus TaxID=6289 RepID=A0A7I4YIN5_HAECO
MIEDPNQYEKLLQSAGKQKGKDGQKKEMGKFVDEEAERILSDLENESWFHGALPLEDIVGLITERGDFLLRSLEPEAGRGAMPCLTVRVENHIKDFPIHMVKQQNMPFFTIDGCHTASSAIAVVQKHFTERIPVAGQALLTRPIPKQSWELSRDKIKMESKLGEGTFGEVWKGTLRHFATDIQVAIKVTKVKEENKALMQEMHKEGRLLRQYKHLNIVAFYGMVIDNDRAMIVMEMVPGGGLDHYLQKNVVSIPDRCSYAFDVSLGLYYLHSKRCMHRDLACRNCLIDNQKNIVKISDFGLSKQADKYKIQGFEKIPVKWQAPEVLETLTYTRECDVYSYGVLVWEIFNDAKEPFEEFSNKTVRRRIADPKFRLPLSPNMPIEIRVIVAACWKAIPEHRPIMKDVAWILKKFIRHTIPGQSQNRAPPVPARQAFSRREFEFSSPRTSRKNLRSRMDSQRSQRSRSESRKRRRPEMRFARGQR